MWMMTPSRKSSIIQDMETLKKVLHSDKSQGGPLESPQLLISLSIALVKSNLFSSHLKTINESICKVLDSSGDTFIRGCGRP